MSYRASIILIIVCSLLLAGWAFYPLASLIIEMRDGPPRRGKPFESWEISNNIFKLRVVAYKEDRAVVAGTYYGFASAPVGSDAWQEFLEFRDDDRPEIPREQVRFITEEIAYAFMGWKYAVTTDGGKNWSIWDADKDLANWQCCNYGLINDVQILPDGKGKMIFHPISKRRGEVPELFTTDYGKHWSL